MFDSLVAFFAGHTGRPRPFERGCYWPELALLGKVRGTLPSDAAKVEVATLATSQDATYVTAHTGL
jgi:hypothetical protein